MAGSLPDSTTNSEATQFPETTEPNLRKKVVQTVVFTTTFFVFGVVRGQEGVIFLDLLLLTDSDVVHGSLIFTASSVGFVIGILFIGILFDTVSNDVLFFICVLLTAMTILAIPWCRTLPLVVAMFCLRSVFMGPADSGCAVVCTKVWLHEAGPFLQNLHFMFAIGGIISPFITQPFLATQPNGDPRQFPLQNLTYSADARVKANGTAPFWQEGFSKLRLGSNDSSVGIIVHSPMHVVQSESRLYIAMYIPGVTLLAICLAMALKILFYSNRDFDRFEKHGPQTDKISHSDTLTLVSDPLSSLQIGLRVLCIALLALSCFSYGCVSKLMINYVMAFTVTYLGWSKTHGSLSVTVFWSGFAAGRFLGIFLSKIRQPRILLYVDYVGLFITFVAMFLADSLPQPPYIWWVMIVSSALFMGSVFATRVSWLNTTVTPVTGKLMSFLFLWDFIGATTHMSLLGYLFEKFSPLWFVYLLCIHSAVLLATQLSIDLCMITEGFSCLSNPKKNSSTCFGQKTEAVRRGSEKTKLLQTET